MTKEELPTTLREMVYMLDIADNNKNPVLKRILRKMRDAADEMESLQSQLAQVTAERDAAVKQMYGNCRYCTHNSGWRDEAPCSECMFATMHSIENKEDLWQWSGLQKEN